MFLRSALYFCCLCAVVEAMLSRHACIAHIQRLYISLLKSHPLLREQLESVKSSCNEPR